MYQTSQPNFNNSKYTIFGIKSNLKTYLNGTYLILQKTLGFSFYYIQGFIFVLFIDACLTDDEPL